jgi:hypothetical protein
MQYSSSEIVVTRGPRKVARIGEERLRQRQRTTAAREWPGQLLEGAKIEISTCRSRWYNEGPAVSEHEPEVRLVFVRDRVR